MRIVAAMLIVAVAGCAAQDPLVASYGPERQYTLKTGRWLRDAALADPPELPGKYSALEGGQLVTVVSGDQDVVVFARKDEGTEIRVWLALRGDEIVDGVMWVREFGGETVWYVGSGPKGTVRVTRREGRDLEGDLNVTFEGRRETPRSGVTGPLVFRAKGAFEAEAPAPK